MSLNIESCEWLSMNTPSATLHIAEVHMKTSLKLIDDLKTGQDFDAPGTVVNVSGNSSHYSH